MSGELTQDGQRELSSKLRARAQELRHLVANQQPIPAYIRREAKAGDGTTSSKGTKGKKHQHNMLLNGVSHLSGIPMDLVHDGSEDLHADDVTVDDDDEGRQYLTHLLAAAAAAQAASSHGRISLLPDDDVESPTTATSMMEYEDPSSYGARYHIAGAADGSNVLIVNSAVQAMNQPAGPDMTPPTTTSTATTTPSDSHSLIQLSMAKGENDKSAAMMMLPTPHSAHPSAVQYSNQLPVMSYVVDEQVSSQFALSPIGWRRNCLHLQETY